MVTFTSFANILPDPINKITDSGDLDGSGSAGPGFASMTVTSTFDNQASRTISGRRISRGTGGHLWQIKIRYNPLFRDDFEPVDSFLATRHGKLKPFFVVVPQHSRPRDSTFATYASSNLIRTLTAYSAGATDITIYAGGVISGNPRPGDRFTITDPADANHYKVYRITAVETDQRYQAATTPPTTTQKRIHISPPLTRNVSINSTINFINPKYRVAMLGDVQEHELDENGLYQFSLDLEEDLP